MDSARASKRGRHQSQPVERIHGTKFIQKVVILRTFALIVSAHPYCAGKSTCHVMHRARALSTKMKNNREDGHFKSFDWI